MELRPGGAWHYQIADDRIEPLTGAQPLERCAPGRHRGDLVLTRQQTLERPCEYRLVVDDQHSAVPGEILRFAGFAACWVGGIDHSGGLRLCQRLRGCNRDRYETATSTTAGDRTRSASCGSSSTRKPRAPPLMNIRGKSRIVDCI